MNYKKSLYLSAFALASLLLSCGGSKKKDIVISDDITVIEIPGPDKSIIAEDILDPATVEMVALETTPESLITTISKMYYLEERYYVLDGNLTMVMMFDKGGKYLGKIHNLGKGPREYIQISYFDVDPVARKVLLADGFSGKIFVLDRDLNIEKIVKPAVRPSNIPAYRDGKFLQGQPYPHLRNMSDAAYKRSDAIVMDSSGTIIKSLIPAECDDENSFYPSDMAIAYEKDGTILMIPGFSNIIYETSSDLESVEPKYYLDFKMKDYKLIDYSNYNKLVKDKQQATFILSDLFDEGYVFTGNSIYNTDNHLFVEYGKNRLYCAYDKVNKKSKTFFMGFYKGLTAPSGDVAMFAVANNISGASGDRMFFNMPVWLWKIQVPADHSTLLQEVSDSIHKMDENANPVILSFKIKEFK